MSAWAEVDAIRAALIDRHHTVVSITKRRTNESVWHVQAVEKCYLYRTLRGEVRSWEWFKLSHARDWRRVSIVALCRDIGVGDLPAIDGNVGNRLTRNIRNVTCAACRVALDAKIEHGAVQIDENGQMEFRPAFWTSRRGVVR